MGTADVTTTPAADTGPSIPRLPEDLEGFLRERLAKLLGVSVAEVPLDRSFQDQGLDSLAVMEFILEIEDGLHIRLHARELREMSTLSELAAYLRRDADARSAAGGQSPTPLPVSVAALGDAGPAPAAAPARGPARNPGPVFLLCAPRSGSTLLRVMLAGHPRLFCPPELHLLAFSGMKAWHDALGPAHLDEGLQRALMELGGQDGPAARRQIAEWVAADLPVQEVYAFLQRAAGDRTLVDKSPTYAGRLDNLRQAEVIFDRPRYIWLVRHPYAAIESFVRNRLDRLVEIQGSDPLTLGEEYWTRCNANLADFLAGIEPDRQRQVRFEDLARDPEAVCHSLCEFLAVPFDERLLTPYDGRRMTDGVHAASLGVGDPGFLRRHAIEPALADAWRIVRLPRAVRENCRRMADRLGYELTAEPASSGAASAAAAGPAPAEVTAPVALQPKGSKPPLFLMHPSSGVVYPFRDLAGLLGEDRPCYAFEDPYLQDGKPRHNSVADYAADYLQGLRQRQPHGPYFLGGYSFGGHVAFEIACRLRAEGETVALVLLLDTEAISQAPEAATSQRWRQWLHMTAGAPRLAPDLAGLIRQAYEGPNPATVGATLRGLVHMHEHVRLILKHRPSFYPGTVTLVRAAGQTTRRHYTDDALGWNGVAADVRVRPVAGNHLQIVRPPYVTELAAAVRASLDEAEEAISVGGGGAQR